jgi:Tetracyclin repressor-like, C-terminal domain
LRAVAVGIDQAMTREWLEPACAAQPEDDPAARVAVAALAFRAWALSHREEFNIVFANTDIVAMCADDSLKSDLPSAGLFTELLGQIWMKYQFPVPSLDEMDPALVEVLRNPQMPMDTSVIPDELRGMIWVFIRSWAALYGTVTLEVFGHLDPRIIESGAMFRQMFVDQASLLGLTDELPRLRELIDAGLRAI